jgi:hypothetical protein
MVTEQSIFTLTCAGFAVIRRWCSAGLIFSAAAALPLAGAHAAGLECPVGGNDSFVTSANFRGLTSVKPADLANEIDEMIYRMRVERPNISYDEMTDALLGAFCNAIAKSTAVSAKEQWSVMRRFEKVLEARLAANTMPAGTEILATVPLPPAVFNALRSQAASAGQTPAQLMTAILSAAAGK